MLDKVTNFTGNIKMEVKFGNHSLSKGARDIGVGRFAPPQRIDIEIKFEPCKIVTKIMCGVHIKNKV